MSRPTIDEAERIHALAEAVCAKLPVDCTYSLRSGDRYERRGQAAMIYEKSTCNDFLFIRIWEDGELEVTDVNVANPEYVAIVKAIWAEQQGPVSDTQSNEDPSNEQPRTDQTTDR